MHSTYRTRSLELMMDIMPAIIRRLVVTIAKHDKNLADQARRAATSVISNHAEADGVRGGHRREHILTAEGSLAELRSSSS